MAVNEKLEKENQMKEGQKLKKIIKVLDNYCGGGGGGGGGSVDSTHDESDHSSNQLKSSFDGSKSLSHDSNDLFNESNGFKRVNSTALQVIECLQSPILLKFAILNLEFVSEKIFKFYFFKNDLKVIQTAFQFVFRFADSLNNPTSHSTAGHTAVGHTAVDYTANMDMLCKHMDQLILILSYHSCSNSDLEYQTCLLSGISKTLSSNQLGLLIFKYSRQLVFMVARELEAGGSAVHYSSGKFQVLFDIVHELYDQCGIRWDRAIIETILVSLCSWWKSDQILNHDQTISLSKNQEQVVGFLSQKLLCGPGKDHVLHGLKMLQKVDDVYFFKLFSSLNIANTCR